MSSLEPDLFYGCTQSKYGLLVAFPGDRDFRRVPCPLCFFSRPSPPLHFPFSLIPTLVLDCSVPFSNRERFVLDALLFFGTCLGPVSPPTACQFQRTPHTVVYGAFSTPWRRVNIQDDQKHRIHEWGKAGTRVIRGG